MHAFLSFAVAIFALALSQSPTPPQQPTAGDNKDDGPEVHKLDTKAGMHAPKPILTPEAVYSQEARAKRLSGKCTVSITVGPDGLVHKARIVRCSDPSFESNSLAAVSKYTFKPATTADGKPVAVALTVEVNFHIDGGKTVPDPILASFASPPNVVSNGPDATGVYPLSNLEAPPTFSTFNDRGYGSSAFDLTGDSPCDVLLTIDAKGKPSEASILHCEHAIQEPMVIKALMASKYKPAMLNGKPVAVRTRIHLSFGEFQAPPP